MSNALKIATCSQVWAVVGRFQIELCKIGRTLTCSL